MAYPITKMHQDGTVEALIDVNAHSGEGFEPAPLSLSVRIARMTSGWAHKDGQGRTIYGPMNGRYFAHEGRSLVEVAFNPDSAP